MSLPSGFIAAADQVAIEAYNDTLRLAHEFDGTDITLATYALMKHLRATTNVSGLAATLAYFALRTARAKDYDLG